MFVGLVTVVAGVVGMDAILPAAAQADALQISTQPALYPGFDTSISDYAVRCDGGSVTVDVSAPAGTDVSVDRQASQTGNFTVQVGLQAGQSFSVVATTGTTTDTYYVRCVPADFTGWTSQLTGTPQAQFYMVGPFARTNFQPIPPGVSGNYLAIFDAHGVPMWWMKSAKQPLDFHLLSNGNVVWTHFDGFSGSEERSLDGTLVKSILAVEPGVVADEHETLLLPNGNYAVIAEKPVSGVDFCGQTNKTITDYGIEEFTPTGSLVFSWFASDHIPMSEIPNAWCANILNTPASNGAFDVYHQNAIEPDGDNFVISFRHLDAVYKISKADGRIVWKLGGVARPESLTVVDDPLGADPLEGQHDPRVLSDGTLTVHDNGFHPGSPRTARAVRYALDLTAKTATLVEQMNDPGTLQPAICCGSARKLPGGDWVMSWGTNDLVTEIDPSGNRVFSLSFDNSLFSYRAWPVLPGTTSRGALRAGMDHQWPRGYPRPRGATPLRVAVVPAFTECTSPNDDHGGPLAVGSCTPPSQTSSFLTVGTSSANGARPNSVGSVTYTAHAGSPSTPANEADVGVRVSITDVRRQIDLSDYTGQLQVHSSARITDLFNGASQRDPATSQDADFPVTVPCAETSNTEVGATCSVSTTFNAIVPGAIVEGNRAIWQLGQTQVFDGGSSGVAGASDARLFEDAGIFVP